MPKRKTILLVAAGVVLLAFAWLLLPDDQPRADGHTLDYWLEVLGTDDYGRFHSRQSEQARSAIAKMGTNAIPRLLAWIDYDFVGSKRERFVEAAADLPPLIAGPLMSLLVPVREATLANTAPQAFGALGPAGIPAIPELKARSRLLVPPSQERSVCALIAIGPPAVPALLNLVTNADPQISAFTITQMRFLGTNATPAIGEVACE